MSEKDLVRLNLQIGGRSFPVRVKESEIAQLKKIEKQSNAKINEFMVKYPGYDRIDVFTMAFMSLISELQASNFETHLQEFEKRLNDLSALLDTSL